jgi:hypothetical protein
MEINREGSEATPYGISQNSRQEIGMRISLSPTLKNISRISDIPSNKKNRSAIIFSGCSITAGESLNKEDTWGWKVYEKIQQLNNEPADYFLNFARSGFSITESIDQVFKYFYEHGLPDAVFILLPNPFRDSKYVGHDRKTLDPLKTEIYKSYFYLQTLCKISGVPLISSTWYKNTDSVNNIILRDEVISYDKLRPAWNEQLNHNSNNIVEDLLSDFESFVVYSEELLSNEVAKYHMLKNKKEKEFSLTAPDKKHPGTSFHDFWADLFYNRYRDIC